MSLSFGGQPQPGQANHGGTPSAQPETTQRTNQEANNGNQTPLNFPGAGGGAGEEGGNRYVTLEQFQQWQQQVEETAKRTAQSTADRILANNQQRVQQQPANGNQNAADPQNGNQATPAMNTGTPSQQQPAQANGGDVNQANVHPVMQSANLVMQSFLGNQTLLDSDPELAQFGLNTELTDPVDFIQRVTQASMAKATRLRQSNAQEQPTNTTVPASVDGAQANSIKDVIDTTALWQKALNKK